MRLIDTIIRGGEYVGFLPEFHLLVVTIDAVSHRIALADVGSSSSSPSFETRQDINACAVKFRAIPCGRPPPTGEDYAYTRPVHTVDKPDTFWVSVRHEYSNGEGIGHVDQRLKFL
jgi:hypothetical protein